MMCIEALMKDFGLRQRDDKHGCTSERCCTEDSGMICMVELLNDDVLRTAR
jgi:hypothetical protein